MQLGFINTATQWRILINSLITSKLVESNMPILAIDKRAKSLIDTTYIKTLKSIFGWPTNVSNKLIRLITGLPNTTILVQKP